MQRQVRRVRRFHHPPSELVNEIVHPQAIAKAPVPPPRFGFFGSATDKDSHSLESRIGSHWFNGIGIVAVLIGMAWFLKLAVDNHWVGPLGRVLIGLVTGAGIIAWSERFHYRGYVGFAYSLKAVGSGILYLSRWAGFSLFHLVPSGVAFAAMILVTAFNGFLSWVQDAELLAVYAIIGGLSTPLLLSTGENHEVTLFSYLLVLDVAVLVLVALRPWSRLLFGAFVGTVLFFAGWWFEYYSDAESVGTAFFLGCFFLIFAFAPRLVWVDPENDAGSSGWNSLALIVLPIVNLGSRSWHFTQYLTLPEPDGPDPGWQSPSPHSIYCCPVFPHGEFCVETLLCCRRYISPRQSSSSTFLVGLHANDRRRAAACNPWVIASWPHAPRIRQLSRSH
jgi:hypothetical protein